MRRVKAIERRKLHHCFNFSFKQYREDNDVCWLCFTQARADFRVISRYIGQKNATFFQGSLPNHAFSELESSLAFFAVATGVTGEKLKLAFGIGAVHDIKDSLLGGNERRQFGQDQVAHR